MTEARSETFKSKDLVAGRTAGCWQKYLRNRDSGQDHTWSISELSAIPGIRYSFTSDDGKSYETDEDESGFSSEDRYYFSPQFGLLYTLNDSITMKSNIAKYYREPSFFELFGDRGFFEGNEMLVPERSKFWRWRRIQTEMPSWICPKFFQGRHIFMTGFTIWSQEPMMQGCRDLCQCPRSFDNWDRRSGRYKIFRLKNRTLFFRCFAESWQSDFRS